MATADSVCPISAGRPWACVEESIPNGFVITPDGVFVDKNDRELICGPCWIKSLTRSTLGTEWGCVINWIDQDGCQRDMAFPARRLSEQRSPLAGDLVSLGLKIVPGKERQLMTFLGSFNLPNRFRLRSTSQLGWIDAKDGSPLFVLPECTIGLNNDEEVVFQPEEHSPTTRTMKQYGSLKQWQAFVASPCEGNPLLVFSLCTAFAGSLLKFAGIDSGGFHLYGVSSKGKTTAIQAAASIWGCGADPAVSHESYIGRWNTTGNALEATAAAHNDGFLALDEMGTCDSRDFGKVVYDLFGGKGKSRLNKNSTLQAQRSWRILGLSTGEISVSEKIEEGSGRRAKTGQLVRLADIPIAEGIILNTHGERPSEFVNNLKKACGQYSGTAGPRFLQQLVKLKPDSTFLRQAVQAEIDAFERNLTSGKDLEPYQRRVMRRFATVATAGLFSIRFGILKFSEAEVMKSIVYARDAWLGDESNKPASVKGMEALRDFILRNPGRFRPILCEHEVVRDLAGYLSNNEGLYLFTKQGFQEAIAGMAKDVVLDELDRRSFLFKNEGDRKISRHHVPGIGRTRLYAVKRSILED